MAEVQIRTLQTARPLDTSEQLDQNAPQVPGSPIPQTSGDVQLKYQKRARAKFFSLQLARLLYALGGPLKRQYGRSMDCTMNIVLGTDGKARTHYCGSRWCMVCNRIRTARAIAKYGPVLDEWGDDAYLVTLTILNRPGYQLRSAIQEMGKAFTSCKRSIIRTHGMDFEAIRKLEVTYNADRNDYHPHYHVVVRGHAQAIALQELWHKFAPTRTSESAQDIRQMDAGGRVEVFKYFTKLLTKDKETGKTKPPDPHSLDVIFSAIKGMRTYQTVGFKLSDYQDPEDEKLLTESVDTILNHYGEEASYVWVQDYADWLCFESGELLSGYEPSEAWRDFVDAMISEESDGIKPPQEPIPRSIAYHSRP